MATQLRKKGGPSRCGSHQHEDRNFPIPLMLFSSYIAAEKSNALIKVFCKELPGILKNINDCKKALENKTKSVARLKDNITQDLKKLELANIVLKELYKEEEAVKLEKEKEIEQLRLEISSCENAKKIMNSALIHYSKSEKVLDSVADESALYLNAQDLIHSYLILLAMNEKLIADEYEFAANFHRVKRDDLELQNLLLNGQYDAMIRQKKLDILENKCQVLKNINNRLAQTISDTLSYRMEDQLNRLQIKRWTFDVCQKISAYKEISLSSEDFFKSLAEIEEFIVFARQIISKLEQDGC